MSENFCIPLTSGGFIFLSAQQWTLENGRPELIGPLINRSFFNWVKTELYQDVLEQVGDNHYYIAHPSVPSELHWLSTFVNDSMKTITPATDSDSRGVKHFYIALESEFDCSDLNCVFHHTWYFHFRRINLNDETVQDSHDFGSLQLDFEAWIRAFLELRFPRISFDYESLLNGESMPHINITRTY